MTIFHVLQAYVNSLEKKNCAQTTHIAELEQQVGKLEDELIDLRRPS